jgi:hypothetical protein
LTANQFVLAPTPWDSRPEICFQLNTCGHSPYVTSSLTRGQVCRLQLLLVLASAVILRSESRGTHDHILLSQIRDSPNWRFRSSYLYPPGTGWAGYIPGHWVSFSSPHTTGRTTVEVFDPASTQLYVTTLTGCAYNISARTAEKTPLPIIVLFFCFRGNMVVCGAVT